MRNECVLEVLIEVLLLASLPLAWQLAVQGTGSHQVACAVGESQSRLVLVLHAALPVQYYRPICIKVHIWV